MTDFTDIDAKIERAIAVFFAAYDTSDETARRALIRSKLHTLYEIILFNQQREDQPAPTETGPTISYGPCCCVGARNAITPPNWHEPQCPMAKPMMVEAGYTQAGYVETQPKGAPRGTPYGVPIGTCAGCKCARCALEDPPFCCKRCRQVNAKEVVK